MGGAVIQQYSYVIWRQYCVVGALNRIRARVKNKKVVR